MPSTVTTGAASELQVSADLLMRGFEVFRAVSPGCSCDLIAQMKSKLFRVQVRTGTLRESDGEPRCALSEEDTIEADILAIVVRSETGDSVHYSALRQGDTDDFFELTGLTKKITNHEGLKTLPCEFCLKVFKQDDRRQRFCASSCRDKAGKLQRAKRAGNIISGLLPNSARKTT